MSGCWKKRKLLDGLDPFTLSTRADVETYTVYFPTEEWKFLHETAVIEHKGILYAAWYSNHDSELQDRTPIRWSTSADGGRTWSEPGTLADDESGAILYCPSVFGVEDGRPYMLINEMVSADHIMRRIFMYSKKKSRHSGFCGRALSSLS